MENYFGTFEGFNEIKVDKDKFSEKIIELRDKFKYGPLIDIEKSEIINRETFLGHQVNANLN